MSSGVLALKNGSSGSAGQDACATPWRAVQRSILRMSSTTSACRRSARSATGQSPFTGCAWPPDSAQASGTPAASRAACRRETRSSGRNGESPAALAIHSRSGRLRAAQSSAARMPASGPAKPGTSSATTVSPVKAKRAGPPLALRIRAAHCGARRSIARSRIVRPAISLSGLSPPPIRRASPPARSTPRVEGVTQTSPEGRGRAPPIGGVRVRGALYPQRPHPSPSRVRRPLRNEFGAALRRSLALGPGSHSAFAACARESGGGTGANPSPERERGRGEGPGATPPPERGGGGGGGRRPQDRRLGRLRRNRRALRRERPTRRRRAGEGSALFTEGAPLTGSAPPTRPLPPGEAGARGSIIARSLAPVLRALVIASFQAA